MVEKQMRIIIQQAPVKTLDLHLYAIAQQIRLRNWNELGQHVVRLFICALWSPAGKS